MKTNHVIILVLFALCSVFCKKPIDPQLVCMEKWSNDPRAFLHECGGCNRNFVAINDLCFQRFMDTRHMGILKTPDCMPNILIYSTGTNSWGLTYDLESGKPLGTISFFEGLDGDYYSHDLAHVRELCLPDSDYLLLVFSAEELKKLESEEKGAIGNLKWVKGNTIEENRIVRDEVIIVTNIY